MTLSATNTTPAGPSSPCRVWGFWATTGFGLISIVVWFVAQTLAAFGVLFWLGSSLDVPDVEIDALTSHALTISIATIVSMPPAIAILALAARRANCSVTDYLALRWPQRADLLIGLAVVVILLPFGDLTSYLTGHDLVPATVVEAYRTARASGHILTLAIALVIAAPLMEELLFRGFLFPGYAASHLGVTGTIVLTSAVWSCLHVQYEVFYIGQIFVLGCVFGWLRWRSGTTTLTLILHALVNLGALLQVAYLAG